MAPTRFRDLERFLPRLKSNDFRRHAGARTGDRFDIDASMSADLDQRRPCPLGGQMKR